MAGPGDALLCGRAKQLGMKVRTAFLLRLQLLDRNAMGVGPCVLPDTGNLPRNFHAGFSACDLEAVALHSLCDVNWSKAIEARQLVAEVAVQRLKPLGQRDECLAVPVEGCVAVIDVLHVG